MAVRDQLIEQTENAKTHPVLLVNNTNSFNQNNTSRNQQPLSTTWSDVSSKSTPTLTEFIKKAKDGLPLGWTMTRNGDSIKAVYLQERKEDPTKDTMITKSLTLHNDGSWSLGVLGKSITKFDTQASERLENYQNVRNEEEFLSLVNDVHLTKICCGNPDIDHGIPTKSRVPENSHRSSGCSFLIENEKNRCNECMKHRKYLRVIKSRQAKQTSMDQRTAIDSHVNYRYLSSQEKDDKIKKLHKELTATKRTLNNVKSKLNRAIQEEGHVLDNEISGYLKEILAIGENLKNELPEGTFRRIFWQQKMQALSCKDTRQIR
jgi:hypothetical protein